MPCGVSTNSILDPRGLAPASLILLDIDFHEGRQAVKRTGWFFLGLFLLTSVGFAATVSVITQEGVIRQDKRFFAPAVIKVPYGSTLEQIGREGDWLRVSWQGKQGWIHNSAVQDRKVSPSSGGKAKEASRDEVALAGKGFTPEVEKAFRDKNPKMRYDLVDKIQSTEEDEAKLQAFVQSGNLKEPGGKP